MPKELARCYNNSYTTALFDPELEPMAATIKVRRIGNSLGVILPKEATDQLHVGDGDTLHLVADKDGVHLTPYDPHFGAAMTAFKRTRRKYRNALRTLSK